MKLTEKISHALLIYNGTSLPDFACNSCLALSYQATHASHSMYIPSLDCVLNSQDKTLDDTRSLEMHFLPPEVEEIVWIREAAIEDDILRSIKSEFNMTLDPWDYMDSRLTNFIEEFKQTRPNSPGHTHAYKNAQSAFQTIQYAGQPSITPSIKILYRSPTTTLLVLHGFRSSSFAIDTIISPIHDASVISYPFTSLKAVPTEAVERVRTFLQDLEFDSTVAKVVNSISLTDMHSDITWLTGEREDSPIESRHSFHPDARKAAHWLQTQIESTGAQCEFRYFLPGFTPNIICRYESVINTSALVVLGAHYDSRGSFGSTRAPGADDDGSGTTALLAVARAIGKAGVVFKSNVELCLFAGEEQGLLGSKAHASELRKADADIVLMIQADMLAYHVPSEPAQLGLQKVIGTREVAHLVGNVSTLYSPELTVGFSSACCSDHQSFHEQGFPATEVSERAGPIADPMYHNSGDLSNREGFDLNQVRSIAKVQLATLLHVAGFELSR